jgi:hypothetical protein
VWLVWPSGACPYETAWCLLFEFPASLVLQPVAVPAERPEIVRMGWSAFGVVLGSGAGETEGGSDLG